MVPPNHREKVPTVRAEIPARVLIIDDEPLIRWSLSAGLRLEGFDAVTAASAEEARSVAGQWPGPDVVLIDLRLHDTDVGALIEDLRRAAPGCRFLVLTTSGKDAQRSGMQGVTIITKPFDLAEVVSLVHAAVAATPAA
jgi:two-component system OmpR family response regulator